MERIASVVVPALPLQLLLRDQPTWRDVPTVVVQDDRPQAPILWANVHARRARILPGMTFAAARNLASDLRAGTVGDDVIEDATGRLFVALCGYSPRVEPVRGDPGAFWLDPSGLNSLFGDLGAWAAALVDALRSRDMHASCVVGFHRFRTLTLARTRTGVHVLGDPRYERRLADTVGLHQLGMTPRLRDELWVLGVRTLGELLQLPAAELRARFGEEAAAVHAAASDTQALLDARPLIDPVMDELQLEPPDDDHTRILFGLRGVLHRLLGRLAARGQALTALRLVLELDHAAAVEVVVGPATPSLDLTLLVELVRLKLEALRLPAAIEAVRVECEGVRTTAAQLALFQSAQRRDLDAGGRALARLRAAFGDDAVTKPVLRAAHLPEARGSWVPTSVLRLPVAVAEIDPNDPPPLQRRVFAKAVPLPPRPRHEPEAWLGRRGAITRMWGPYRLSGGWWRRTVERDYFYAQTQHGELLWMYFDKPRARWFLQGVVD
jgi:protein ImuB